MFGSILVLGAPAWGEHLSSAAEKSRLSRQVLAMRFTLIDRIVELERGARIRAVKSVSLSEEYLRDHFPRFPVLPGVFMLEAMTQASAWLIRATEDFAHSVVLLKEARNVKYADFVTPGHVLSVTAEIKKFGERETRLSTSGWVDGTATVSAKLTLERFNLADTNPEDATTDIYIKREMRTLFAILYRGDEAPAAPSGDPGGS